MLVEVDAIFENGVLRPLTPLPLTEREQVKVQVSRSSDEAWLDAEFMDACAAESDTSITLEQVRAALSKIRGSLDQAIDDDRGPH